MWVGFIVGVGLTTGNMVMGFFGTPLIASPINCGALAMVISLIIVPVVSLFTKAVPFEVDSPHAEGAIDREYVQELERELARVKEDARQQGREGVAPAAKTCRMASRRGSRRP